MGGKTTILLRFLCLCAGFFSLYLAAISTYSNL
nr:MAG TPA: Ras family [Caudoviricetes sp.]